MDKIRNMVMAGIIKESVELSFDIPIPNEINIIKDAFAEKGVSIYVVGGAVRDAVQGNVPKDYDLTTQATPDEVEEILNAKDIYNYPRGKQFGVVSAVINKQDFEIATFRSEEYDGSGRRPSKVVYSNMTEDAMRRDLTINALYYDIDKKKIIDLVGGLEDLKNKTIRTVGNPDERFYEDRLRVMRAIRFKNVMGGNLGKNIQNAILKFQDMPGVSNDRIRKEFYSGLEKSKNPAIFLEDLQKFGIFKRMFPNLNINNQYSDKIRNPILVVSSLLKHNDEKATQKAMGDMIFEKHEKKAVKFLTSKLLPFLKGFRSIDISLEDDFEIFDQILDGIENRVLQIERSEFLEWCNLHGINSDLVKKVLQFKRRKLEEIPEIVQKIELGELPKKGKETGDAVKIVNLTDFLSTI